MSEQSFPASRPIPPGRGLRYRLEAIGASLVFGLFSLLPLDRASDLGGWLARLVGPRLGISKRARLNLQRAMPELDDAAARRVIIGMWDNLGRVVAEYPHLNEFDIYKPDGRVELVDAALIEPILAAGRKIIFVSAHFGNWEIASLALTQRGLSVMQVYRAPNNPLVDRVIGRFRSIVGSELIPKGAIAARRAIEALQGGSHLGVLVDQKMNDGIAVPFFGRPAMTAPAAALLAARFDCAIVPARCDRLAGARFRITVFPPVEVVRSGQRRADALATMTNINAIVESWIRERPELWFWLHRRWPD